jgi:hypothetical protein
MENVFLNIIALLFSIIIVLLFYRKPLVIHFFAIVGYIFLIPLFSNFIIFLLLFWLFWLIIDSSDLYKYNFHNAKWIIGFSCLIHLSILVGFVENGNLTPYVLWNDIIKGFIPCTIWSIILLKTIKTETEIGKIFIIYAVVRAIESGLFGLIQYSQGARYLDYGNYTYDLALRRGISGERLTGLIIPDPVEVAFFLITVIGVLFYVFKQEKNKFYLVLLIVSILAIIFTWSRSGLIFIFLMLFILANKLGLLRIKFKYFLSGLLIFSILIYFLQDVVSSRISEESRLTSENTLLGRVVVYYAVSQNLDNIPLFGSGITDPILASYNVTQFEYSTENLLLQTFVQHGYIAGILFLVMIIFSLYYFLNGYKHFRINKSGNRDVSIYGVILLTYIFCLLMSQTLYIRFDEPLLWIYFTSSVILYTSTKRCNI